jgi:hypothetical protein
MILRLTQKLLKLSKTEQTNKLYVVKEPVPGEWYVNTLKTGQTGKTYLLFFHKQTKISFVFSTKSIKIASEELPARLKAFLNQNGFEDLFDKFEIDTEPQVMNTNCARTLAYMTNLAYNYSWHLSGMDLSKPLNNLFFENIAIEYLFKSPDPKKKYESVLDLLNI